MQHVILYARHSIEDISPFSQAIRRIKQIFSESGVGEYVGDDMAIDGGDVEAVFCGKDADLVFDTIFPVLKELPFLHGAKVTLLYGQLDSEESKVEFYLEI